MHARTPWLERILPLFKVAAIVSVISGGWGAIDSGAIGTLFLYSASVFFAISLGMVAVSIFMFGMFSGKGLHEVRVSILETLRCRDIERVVGFWLVIAQFPILFFSIYYAFLFSSTAFQRTDLAALLIASISVATFLLGQLGTCLLRIFIIEHISFFSFFRHKRFGPLYSIGIALGWFLLMFIIILFGFILKFWSDLAAADLNSQFIFVGLAGLYSVLCMAWILLGVFEHKKIVFALDVFAAFGLLSIVIGMFGFFQSPVTTAYVNCAPGVKIGLSLGRWITDYDNDGFSSLLAGGDCAPYDSVVYPGALDLSSNGLDENCSGSDYTGNYFETPEPHFVDPSSICPNKDCNVIFISLDSFRADQMTATGGKEVIMPHLEKLSKNGATFLNAYTPGPGTMTTLPAMLTGKFDSTLKMDPHNTAKHPLHNDEELISETLLNSGISTFAVFEHGLLNPLNQGWTEFYNPWFPGYKTTSTIRFRVNQIIHLIKHAKDKPFFLYSHLLETHHDFLMHEDFGHFGNDDFGRYRSELAYSDHQIKRIFDAVRAMIPNRRTIFIVAGDHGEGFGEHGIVHHNEGLYRSIMHVPLIVWYPGISSRQLRAPVSLLDIAPTLRNIYGIAPSPKHVGVSLLSNISTGEQVDDNRLIYHQAIYDESGVFYNLVGITQGRFRLLHDMRNQTFEFYDVVSDPRELVNLANDQNMQYSFMKDELIEWIESIGLSSSFVHRYWERGNN